MRSSGRIPTPPTARRLLVVLVLLLAGLPGGSPGLAQETIAEARAELERVEEEKLTLSARIDVLAAEDAEVFKALQAAEELVARQEAHMEAAGQQLRAQIAVQRQKEAAIGWARSDIEDVRLDAQAILVEVYLHAGSERTATLLGSEDLTQGLRRLALLEAVHGNAGDLVDQIRLAEDRYDAALAEAASSVAEVERLQAGLEADLAVLEERRLRQAAIKAELDKRRRALEREFAAWDQEASELEHFIQVEEYRQKAEEWVRAQEAAAGVTGFSWPTAGSVSSGYGNRLHPILGVYRLHAGIDLGTVHGQPVYSARAGVVLTAGPWGGYGNAVVIDHGDGLASVYAHMSEVAVRPGDLVMGLEQVGSIGSTGLSTGPHLHFEIRLNGTAVDPLRYLP
ncbi:MAG: peptidoglycan DD-metalloendopeptidase family protein [bacterium]|nr:peptidoglycan DD-metalloendopeptidase family protein [bacterium]